MERRLEQRNTESVETESMNINARAQDMESPDAVRMSLAAAMTLGFKHGLFYRGARLYCINLLQTYTNGCIANCAYCGLSRGREGAYSQKSFIRVTWPTYTMDQVIDTLVQNQDAFSRICISMVTRKRSCADLVVMAKRIQERVDRPISGLISPTVLDRDRLMDIRNSGIDKIGIAVDAATPEIFDRLRGTGVKAPHRWYKYWEIFDQAVEIFGAREVGSHLIVGLGESEREMAHRLQDVYDRGGLTHLFSFYPEANSQMSDCSHPPAGQYRRIQLARYLVDEAVARADDFSFSDTGRIMDFGVSSPVLEEIIDSGEPFRTSGCAGRDGVTACNRPFANFPPGEHIRNYPFPPEPEDIEKIRQELHS